MLKLDSPILKGRIKLKSNELFSFGAPPEDAIVNISGEIQIGKREPAKVGQPQAGEVLFYLGLASPVEAENHTDVRNDPGANLPTMILPRLKFEYHSP